MICSIFLTKWKKKCCIRLCNLSGSMNMFSIIVNLPCCVILSELSLSSEKGFALYPIVSPPLHQGHLFYPGCGWSLIYSALLFLPLLFDAIDLTHENIIFKVTFPFLYKHSPAPRRSVATSQWQGLCYISFMTQKTICHMLLVAWTTLLLGSSLSLPSSFTY